MIARIPVFRIELRRFTEPFGPMEYVFNYESLVADQTACFERVEGLPDKRFCLGWVDDRYFRPYSSIFFR